MPERPPRLEQLFPCYDPPLYFVTFNTHHRRRLLTNADVHQRFIAFARIGETRGVAVGRYVLMPDHAHLFVQGNPEFVLTQWVRLLKRELSKAIPCDRPHWQKGFFDHVIRNAESYAGKWEYVRENPVRAGLAVNVDACPWQGQLVRLEVM